MSESGESTESGESADSNSFNAGISYMIEYGLRSFPYLVIGILISLTMLIRNLMYNRTIKNILYSLIPFLIGLILTIYIHTPKPKYYYMVDVMFGEKPKEMDFERRRTPDAPMVGSSVLTINDKDYIFIGGGENQDDKLFEYNEATQKMIDIIKQTGISSKEATYSALSFDMDKNGLDDLLVGRKSGVYLYKQVKPFIFKKSKIYESDGEDKLPLALSVSDYNRDGNPDIYVSYFINFKKYKGSVFNEPSHNRGNVMLQGKGNNQFVDVTVQTNSAGKSNTFTSAFVDLDNDGWVDIVTAHDSADIEILRNLEGKGFESIKPIDGKGNWMGIGVGDYDKDGDMDLFFTNLGTDTPKDRMSIGDLKKEQKQIFSHILLRNDGNFKFVNVTNKMGISGEGFGWGAVFADLNNNSKLDLLFADKFHINKAHMMIPSPSYYYEQNNNGQYQRKIKYVNKKPGQTPLIADINKDNIKDVVWINMVGPALYHLNKNNSNFINIRLPETTDFVNATVILDTGKEKQTRQVVQGGVGFGSNQTNLINFGLGKNDKVKSIRVKTITGKVYQVNNPKINSQLTLKDLKSPK